MTERPLTFARLGLLGGLGNCLWQIASTVGLARTWGRPVIFPESFAYRPFFAMPDEWFGDIAEADDTARMFWDQWPGRRGNTPNRRWAKYGQTIGFWDHAQDEIRAAFAPSPRAAAVLDALPEPGPDDVAVHVRRGDYLSMPNHLPALPVRYYALASDHFWVSAVIGAATDVHVYTDDPGWCEQSLPWEVRHYGEPEADEPTDWCDMLMMARYQTLVVANSSYSWWSAWLAAPDALVVAPDPWFGPSIDTPSPALPEWIKVAA